MSDIKSQRHHWWPRCVSKHWAANDGRTGWIRPDGSEMRLLPEQLGVIGNAHHVKLGKNVNDTTDWDYSFEKVFDDADSNFPNVIAWLESLDKSITSEQGFTRQEATDEQLSLLTECIVSLAVRAPKNREASVSVAEHLRGPLPERERNALIGLNMQHAQRMLSDSIGSRGKFAVLYSVDKEFIYGDGFYNNVSGLTNPTYNPKLFAPLTPSISVLITRPSSYTVEPRFSSIALTNTEVDICNRAVQVYSGNSLFYRNEKPELIKEFRLNKFLKYSDYNPLDVFFNAMPGVIEKRHSHPFL